MLRRLGFVACTATLVALSSATPASAQDARSSALGGLERAVITKVNQVRGQNGLGPLRASRRLSTAAEGHSGAMARGNFLGHGAWESRVRRYVDANRVGEVVAALSGRRRGLASRVVGMWLRSPPHRAVLLDGAMHRIGVGMRTSGGMAFFTADLAS
jgi:uncharacterized protein YkwD